MCCLLSTQTARVVEAKVADCVIRSMLIQAVRNGANLVSSSNLRYIFIGLPSETRPLVSVGVQPMIVMRLQVVASTVSGL